jgi:uncharacterized protein (DUF58 family)
MLSKEFKRIAKIQFKMDRLATGLLSGLYHSRFKGIGIEFEEVREFQAGDEVRAIDANVSARMGAPFIKLFREERELTLMLVLDISGSMQFGSRGRLKREVLGEIASVLAFAAIKNRDKVGLLLYTDRVEHYVPPHSGVRHVWRIIRDLMLFEGKGKRTDLDKALKFLGNVQRKRAVLFLLSDFLGNNDLKVQVRALAKKHDLIGIAIQDPLESLFPPTGLLLTEDLEDGTRALVDANEGIKIFNPSLMETRKTFEKCGASWVQVYTDKPYLPTLVQFLSVRKKL